jgi:GNAT superfamily N-acetyltransferase
MVRSGIPSISTVRELLGMKPVTAATDYNEALWVRDKNGQWVTYVGLSLEEMWVTDPATGQEVPQFSYGDIYSSNIDTTPDYKARVASPTLPDGTVVFEVGSSVNDLGKTEPPPEGSYDTLPTELPTDLEPGETAYVRVNPDTFELDTAEEEARASLDTEPVEEEQPPPPPAEARLIPQREAAEVLRAAGVNAAEATQIARDNGVWTRDGKTFAAVPTPRNLEGDRLAAAERTLMQLEEETQWLVEDMKTTREAGGTPAADDEEFLVAMEEATENQQQEVAKVRGAIVEAAGPEGITPEQAAMAVEALGYLEEAVAGLPTHLRERDGQQRPFRVMLDERITGPRGAAGVTSIGSDSMGISPRHFHESIGRNHMQGTRWAKMGEHAIRHELGHMIDVKADTEGASFSNFKTWGEAIETGLMSDYGKTQILEGYAEAFSMWQSDPDHPVARIYAEKFGWEEEDLDAEQPPPPQVDAASVRERIQRARAQAQQPAPEVAEQGSPTLTQEQIDAINNAETQFDAPEGWESNYLGGGASQPQLWTAPDGSRLVAKTGVTPNSPAQVWAEQIASTILQQAGFPYSPTAIANTDGTVVGITYAADGTPLIDPKGFSYFTAAEGVKDVVDRLTDPEDVMRFFVFDLATGNRDRHAGNLMTANSPDGSGHLLPIDHGMVLVYSNNHPLNVDTLLHAEMHQHTVPSYLDRLRRENPDMDPWDMEAHLRASIKDSFEAISVVEFSDSDKAIGQSHINQLARNLEYWNNPEMLDHTVGRVLNSYQMTLMDRRDEWFDQPRRVAEEQPPSPTETAASPTLNPEQAAAIDSATDHRTPPPGWTAEPIGDGVSEPYLWTAPDGTRMVAKTGPVPGRVHMVHAEQIAPVILQQIGFPHAPTGYSNPDGTVAGLSFATDGTPLTDARTIRGTGLIGYEQIITDALPKMNDPADFVRLLAFDLAAYNTDRHSANLFLADDPDGKLHILPIDHGEALNPWQTVPPDMIFDILLSTSVHNATLPLYVKKLRADNPDMGPREILDHLRGIIQTTLDDIGNVTFSADDKEKGGEAIDKLASTLEVVNSPEFMDEAMKSVVSLFTTNQPYTEYQWWHPPAPQSEEQPPPPTDAAAVRDRIRAARNTGTEGAAAEGSDRTTGTEGSMVPRQEAEELLTTAGMNPAEAAQVVQDHTVYTNDGQSFVLIPNEEQLNAKMALDEAERNLRNLESRIASTTGTLERLREGRRTQQRLREIGWKEQTLRELEETLAEGSATVDAARRDYEAAANSGGTTPEQDAQAKEALGYLEAAVSKLPAWRRSNPDGAPRHFRVHLDNRTLRKTAMGSSNISGDRMFVDPDMRERQMTEMRKGWAMPAGFESVWEYTVNHELGHMTDQFSAWGSMIRPDVWEEAIATGQMSGYGKTSIVEGYAEAFAQWMSGDTEHPVVRIYADAYGWGDEERPARPDAQTVVDFSDGDWRDIGEYIATGQMLRNKSSRTPEEAQFLRAYRSLHAALRDGDQAAAETALAKVREKAQQEQPPPPPQEQEQPPPPTDATAVRDQIRAWGQDQPEQVAKEYHQTIRKVARQHGLSTTMRSTFLPDGSAILNIDIRDGRRKIGTMTRTIVPSRSYASHVLFELDPPYQGKGIGSQMLQASEDLYRSRGIKRITLQANKDVGGYTWARQGFQFSAFDPTMPAVDQQRARKKLIQKLTTVIQSMPPSEHKDEALELLNRVRSGEEVLPAQFAVIGWTEGADNWAGKQMMLKAAWDGYKTLRDEEDINDERG